MDSLKKCSFILGTAGHVDHGKTQLVQALTGLRTDRLPEEKKRGMSIQLGYAPLHLEDFGTIGIIDVPGHENFIKNMVKGATQMMCVLFVVSAKEGICTQTIEHLEILKYLGVLQGIVVLSKTDLVLKHEIEARIQEIKEFTKGSFLENAPIVEVSSRTLAGIEVLKESISKILNESFSPLEENRLHYLPIDRIFSKHGFGTIVTGTLMAGSLVLDQEVEIYPSHKKAKIRRIEAYGKGVSSIKAPSRVALNLKGVDRDEIQVGNVLSVPNRRLDTCQAYAKIQWGQTRVRPTGRRPGSDLIDLFFGTSHAKVQVKKKRGMTYYLKFFAPQPLILGDRFILRTNRLLGGGQIIDASPVSKQFWLEKDPGQMQAYIQTLFKERPELRLETLSDMTGRLPQSLAGFMDVPQAKRKKGTDLFEICPQVPKIFLEKLKPLESSFEPFLAQNLEKEFLKILEANQEIIRLPKSMYLTKVQLERVRQTLQTHFQKNESICVSDIKTYFNLSRKFAIPYLEFFDIQKWTIRKGDVRVAWKI